ncbi:cupin domain-containing protein [Verrucosispora sp. ts21]|uniref:cupin domain-containing protein n=1 Tax=Verrucosispora sp. ts21 TaxID=2069341 RepID=UPI0018EADBD2|nr:cupin domain-containing protein [Verrucosispora sp. ts21]
MRKSDEFGMHSNGNGSLVGTLPRNPAIDDTHPDLVTPPSTDDGLLPNMVFPFSLAHTRRESGGWTREITDRLLPIAHDLAIIDMKLDPGAYRELHWHIQSEWSIILKGSGRIGAVDQEGRNFLEDVKEGDLWYFPAGIPHYIQAFEEGMEFLLVFDDGCYSEDATFQLTDFLAHVPRSVIAKNFGWTEEQMRNLPEREKYMFHGQVPPPLAEQRVFSPTGDVPRTFKHAFLSQTPERFEGGSVRIADSTNFAAATTTTVAMVELEPGAMRELHWHPNGAEMQYVISGQGRIGVFSGGSTARTFNLQRGDVGYVPISLGHYIENLGDEPFVYLELFRTAKFEDMSLAQWLANVPPQVVADTLNMQRQVIEVLPKVKNAVQRH